MRKILIVLILISSVFSYAQNPAYHKNGVVFETNNTGDPVNLEIAGKSAIYWNGTKFRKWNGTSWSDLVTGGGSIDIEDEGVSTVSSANILNFVGSAVTVTDAGGGEATITIVGGSGESTSVSDTNDIDLTLTGSDITATTIIDVAAGNKLTKSASGLFVDDDLSTYDNTTSNFSTGAHTTNTDNQVLDVSQLTGTNLELSLSGDGEATKVIDLSSLQDGTGLENVVEDLTPELGGHLFLNGSNIRSNGSAIVDVDFDNNSASAVFQVIADANTVNLLTVKENGEAALNNTTIADINTVGNKAIVTKEYADANYSSTGTDDQTASEVNTNTAGFNGNLSGTDTTVQLALDTIDDLVIGGGVSFGSVSQIPYTNATTNDFDYSSNLTFNGTQLDVNGANSTLAQLSSGQLSLIGTFGLNSMLLDPTNSMLRYASGFNLDLTFPSSISGSNKVVTFKDESGTVALLSDITGGANQLSDLTDVNTSTPTNRNVLVADGVDWESRPLVEEDISNFGTYGDVFKVGTPVDNQIGVWTGDGTIEGTTGFTFNSTTHDFRVGINDANGAVARIYGGTTSSGGILELYNAADSDTNTQNWVFYPEDGDLKIQATGGDVLVLDDTTLGMTAPSMSTADINTLGAKALITKEYADANYSGTGTDDQVASEVPYTPYLTIGSTNVQNAINELKDEVDGLAVGGDGLGSDGDKGDITVGGSGTTLTIDNDAVTYAKMQNSSVGFTVLGKTATGSGDFAEIVAGTDGVLRRSGTGNLSFGSLVTNNYGNNTVSLAKMSTVATQTFLGRNTPATGNVEALSIATAKTMLNLSGTNSGDQTSIVGITGTKAQFDTALTDGNFLYVGDVTSNATHTGEVTGATALTIASGVVDSDNITNGTIDELDLDTSVNASLDLADSSVQQTGSPISGYVTTFSSSGVVTGSSNLTYSLSAGRTDIGTGQDVLRLTSAAGSTYIDIDNGSGNVVVVGDDLTTSKFVDSNGTESLTGTALDLSDNITGKIYNEVTPSTATAFTTSNLKVGGFAYTYINSASEPTVNGSSTEIGGSPFQASTLMKLVAYSPDGTTVEHFFVDLGTPSSGGASPLTTKGDVYTYSTVDARLGVGSNGSYLTADSAESTGLKWSKPEYSKTITIQSPSASEDISIFFTNKAITVTEIRAITQGTTPSTTWTIKHETNRSSSGNAIITAGTTTTSQTSGNDLTSFNDATIVADSFIWLETTATSGTVNDLSITIFYTID